ncbi:hypothetical protein UlMin_008362 [Ulmus minor]
MVQKRSYDEEEICNISLKCPRQAESSKELVSFSESDFPEHGSEIPKSLENGPKNAEIEGDEKLSGDIFSDLPKGGDEIETSAHGFSFSSWPTSSTSEEDSLSQPPFHIPLFPEYFNPPPSRTLALYEDVYNILLTQPPRKFVPIGPDHQADIPPWGQEDNGNVSASDEERLVGVCIMPMPDSTLFENDQEAGKGRTECNCEDEGSVSCVRKHILEAREKLVKTNGPEKFMELGFSDMGEQVAERWSEEEEHLFHQVIFSNPASSGRNFWDKLPAVFPSRTKKEIVSYYFNVFMLRKRAEQNRCYPINIDSDNDEWQGSDDYGDHVHGIAEEDDDDSVVESPIYGDEIGHNPNRERDLLECDEDVADDICDDNVNFDYKGAGINQVSETCPRKLDNYGSSPRIQPNYIAWDVKGDQEVQYNSCTSSDAGAASIKNRAESENGHHCPSTFSHINGGSSGGDHGYALEHCDTKGWDVGYLSCPQNKVDFLPTCHMIEEVFREEKCNNNKVRDGNNLS